MAKNVYMEKTWNKAWTKSWLIENTTFAVPATIVYAEPWLKLEKWLNSTSCPTGKPFVMKPTSLSRSRGVRLLVKDTETGKFRGVDGALRTITEIIPELVKELPNTSPKWKSIIEEYVDPPPLELKVLQYDGSFNPLVRIIMQRGDFHFGEVHVPTMASIGRGTLQGGARRICFNYKGELLQQRPDVSNDLEWAITNYGTKVDVTGMVLPDFEDLVDRIRRQICQTIAPQQLFAFDGCYRQTAKGSEFVCIEIENRPNVKHLATYDGLRKPA